MQAWPCAGADHKQANMLPLRRARNTAFRRSVTRWQRPPEGPQQVPRRKAEEKELMAEFRRQELSTWMDSDSGVDAEAVTFDPDVRFVPYRPYVKSR